MISRLRLENFRSHGSTEIRLQPLSLLVGPAGAGKSNLLKALVFVQNTLQRSILELMPPRSPFEFRLTRSRWADETAPMGFEIEVVGIDGFDAVYVLRFADSPQGIYILEETLQRRRSASEDWQWVFQRRWSDKPELGEFGLFTPYEPSVLNRLWIHDKPDSPHEGRRFARNVAKALWKTGYFHLETSWLKEPSDDREWKQIGYSGQGLPGFLEKLLREDQPRFKAIEGAMRDLLPSLERIVINRAGPDKLGLAMIFQGFHGYVNAPDLSDGTLLTLGLLAVANARKAANLLCIEEPETGLHPGRLRWLFDRFVELAYPTDKNTAPVQILLTSHSPYLVDLFKDMPQAVTVVEHKNSRTSMRNLVEIKTKLHDESTGSSIGHEWATGLFEGM